ncbi:MAG TPA: sodium:proton antiporter [Planctomycetota bacterium]|nr:sodium:proton antiporter [Planctomycetota bacterium]
MEYAPPPVWSFAPFIALLLAIAILPLVPGVAHWWERNRSKLMVALALALATIAYYFWVHPGLRDPSSTGELIRGGHAVLHVLEHAVIEEFLPFIILLFSLYTISGGILLKGDIVARPAVNSAFLAAGALLANFIGTTGASMLLIRPILRTNAERARKVHTVIFFIFTVSNAGGCLTPLGDPPLFLGYLKGVPFWWTLHLAGPWLLVNGALIFIYFLWDRAAYRRERRRDVLRDEVQVEPLSIEGGLNFLWLLGVVACVALVGSETGWRPFPHAREALLLALTAVSWFGVRRNAEIRRKNAFTLGPILEVACLFIGIFVCMQTPVEFLRAHGANLGLESPTAFFWATGGLSGFLDNAPTYVVFFETARALTVKLLEAGAIAASHTVPLLGGGVIDQSLLLAVSMGAVFMGASTYIGNGPNFMVKTIAEQSGIKMPSFFGYMAYSVAILIPLFVVVTVVFLW